jgi:hypothetical protein
MKHMRYDINVTLKPLNIIMEADCNTSCEEMHDLIMEEVYRKLESHNPEVFMDKVCLRIIKEIQV